MPEHREGHHDPDEGKRHLALWLAVGGTMAVIVALWAMLLPAQMGDFSFFGARQNADWESIRAKSAASRQEFSDSLARLKNRLDNVTDPKAQAAAAGVEALKQKLETQPN
ncbi:MAG: hypothetical protein AAB692_00735 [Patescibacteria group bacterium]